VVIDRIPATLQLTAAALLFSVVLGVPAGVISASRPGSLVDRVGRVVAIAGQSMPVFWVGLWLILVFAVNFAHLISGAVVTETIFAWPGIGRLLVDSIFARDYAVVQTVVFFAALVIVIVNLLVDLTYAWLDPRIRVVR
jgi:ABC-type dipeptide/oligopeptide/nickel transport system permease component